MNLIANVGSLDKIVRIVAGLALVVIALLKLDGSATLIALAVGVVLIVTAVINFCPLYRILGLRTTKPSA